MYVAYDEFALFCYPPALAATQALLHITKRKHPFRDESSRLTRVIQCRATLCWEWGLLISPTVSRRNPPIFPCFLVSFWASMATGERVYIFSFCKCWVKLGLNRQKQIKNKMQQPPQKNRSSNSNILEDNKGSVCTDTSLLADFYHKVFIKYSAFILF